MRSSDQDDAAPRTIEHRVGCAGVTAIWTGEKAGNYDHWTTLAFEVAGRRYIVTPEIVDHDGFEIFSPDCRRVLLLKSAYGPYHVVRTQELVAYLGGAAPESEFSGTPDPDGITGTGRVHDGGWVSNSEVAFLWGCCDPPMRTRVVLPALR